MVLLGAHKKNMSCPSQVLGVYDVLHLKMDLQKLRPTYSQWRAPVVTASAGRARVHVARAVDEKPTATARTGAKGDLWDSFYDAAVLRGHPDPERMATSSLRARERAIDIEAARRKVKMTLEKPKPVETVVAAREKKGRALPHESVRCKAKTLEGKQCGFRATCSGFCSKHHVVNKI